MPTMIVKDRAGGGRNLWLWCPGCEFLHMVAVPGADGRVPEAGPVWTWDGNVDRPTIGPSILVTSSTRDDVELLRCHSYVEEGRWRFLEDSRHALAGQTVDLVDVPEPHP